MTTEKSKPKKLSDSEAILEAVKELTKTVADMAVKLNAMKEIHDKWVRAGKF
jgi:hypothetical protein